MAKSYKCTVCNTPFSNKWKIVDGNSFQCPACDKVQKLAEASSTAETKKSKASKGPSGVSFGSGSYSGGALSVVGNKEAIQQFEALFKYAPAHSDNGYSKSDFLRAFLAMVVTDKNTYIGSESSENTLKPSREGTVEDWELNGFDLFKKYINYDLGTGKTNAGNKFVFNKTLLDPTCGVFQYKNGYNTIDQLTFFFAVTLHKNCFFTAAVDMYELYLAQQPSVKTVDCILARFYIELAKNSCADVQSQKTSSDPLKIKEIKSDLVQLYRSTKNDSVDLLKDAIVDVDLFQKDFSTFQAEIQRIYDGRPDSTVDNITTLQTVVLKIKQTIKQSESSDVVKQLESNFRTPVSRLEKDIRELTNASIVISKYYKGGDCPEPSDSDLIGSLMSSSSFIPDRSEIANQLIFAFEELKNALNFDGVHKEERLAQLSRIEGNILAQKDVCKANIERRKANEEASRRNEEARIKKRKQQEEARERSAAFWHFMAYVFFTILIFAPIALFVYSVVQFIISSTNGTYDAFAEGNLFELAFSNMRELCIMMIAGAVGTLIVNGSFYLYVEHSCASGYLVGAYVVEAYISEIIFCLLGAVSILIFVFQLLGFGCAACSACVSCNTPEIDVCSYWSFVYPLCGIVLCVPNAFGSYLGIMCRDDI